MRKYSLHFKAQTVRKICLCLLIFFIGFHLHAVHPTAKAIKEPVKLGLLVQDKTSVSAIRGAEIAISLANKNGGLKGRPFQLLTKSMEGPWGTGSKMAVDLIWEDEVWALIGSHDGRNAHLVEQAATKSIVVFVSAWATDPTLAQAYVPWFLNVVPNDIQQADALIQEIHNLRKYTKVAIISDKVYDSSQSLKYYLQRLKKNVKSNPFQYRFEDYSANPGGLADQLKSARAQCVLIFCSPTNTLKITRSLKQNRISVPLYGTIAVFNENELKEAEIKELAGVLKTAHNEKKGGSYTLFQDLFFKKYGIYPGLVASYAFDATSVLINAIKTAGDSDRQKIQDALYKLSFDGVTGTVRFDQNGNRIEKLVVSSTP